MEWRSDGVAEWWIGGLVDWWITGVVEWSDGLVDYWLHRVWNYSVLVEFSRVWSSSLGLRRLEVHAGGKSQAPNPKSQ
jgi:hypothetical protein